VDNSVDIADSGNTTTSYEDSFNTTYEADIDTTVDISDSGNTTDNSVSDDDVVDIDASLDVPLT
jgi:hypothetical protein